jgi:alpha/beta superfamily hydrolase
MKFPPRIQSFELNGPAGRLEALLNQGSANARCVALVCHPHPLGGGTMHNKVVYHAMKALNDPEHGLNWPVLRFNFRGVGRSAGVHYGLAEREDVLCALEWLQGEYGLPILLAGFSFGSVMAIEALTLPGHSSHVAALAALGLPVRAESRQYTYPSLPTLKLPKLFLSGDRDEFAPVDELTEVVNSASEPKRFKLILGGDHFFSGALREMQAELLSWLNNPATLPQ